ncbi:MAG: ABC transporter substrate-binding protein [Deltaproteobacteria bacterium]|nr:ABC transporter substrate-binding protein [Deltaproteobacteria bacterium]MBW1992913.1 ABC transporter substrate-binding protein [Deltaproteobacteria bacterium]MBW2151465.1 ABC transporter substrate-binding protein [Deltaproteobacteria bacterium]
MKKWYILIFFTVAFLLSGNIAAKEWKKVRIGTEGAYPPFNYIDKNGQLQGFDIDIAKALCKSMGVQCEFVIQDWDGIIPGLLAKKYDCIIASMSITEERKKKVDFTDKYYMTPARFVAKKGSGFKISKEGLKGKTVGVQRATVAENFLRDNFGDAVKIKSYATQDEANMDLASGRIDLVIADSVVLLGGFLQTDAGKNFEFVGPGFTDKRWFGEGIGIAVRKGEDELREMLNKAIKQIRADGTYQKINAKYFDFDVYGR